MEKTYRTGFEPDKSAVSWVGMRVDARTDSGWSDKPGYTGIVVSSEDSDTEYGWFRLKTDDGIYDRILAHTTEFYPPAKAEAQNAANQSPTPSA